MALFDNLLVIFILLLLATLIYCRITNKTLTDVIKEVREGFTPPQEVLLYE